MTLRPTRRDLLATTLGAAISASALAQTAKPAAPPIALKTNFGPWKDDFDGLLRRRTIRILVPYSRTLFFQDKGTLYGTTVQAAQALEAWINKTTKPAPARWSSASSPRPVTSSFLSFSPGWATSQQAT